RPGSSLHNFHTDRPLLRPASDWAFQLYLPFFEGKRPCSITSRCSRISAADDGIRWTARSTKKAGWHSVRLKNSLRVATAPISRSPLCDSGNAQSGAKLSISARQRASSEGIILSQYGCGGDSADRRRRHFDFCAGPGTNGCAVLRVQAAWGRSSMDAVEVERIGD